MPNQRIRGNQITDQRTIIQNEHEEAADAKRVLTVDENGNPINSSNPLPVDAIINLTATNPDTSTIFNKLVLAANIEETITLPAKTSIFTITARSNKAVVVQYSFVLGESGTKFVSVWPGSTRKIEGLSFDIATPIYFMLNRVDPGGTIVEIETWKA
jgi:hypothetical protein